jgi:hypothetical protein
VSANHRLCFRRAELAVPCAKVKISYMEIYNNAGYDLLDPDHESKKLEDLRKVNIMEDGDGNMHLVRMAGWACRKQCDFWRHFVSLPSHDIVAWRRMTCWRGGAGRGGAWRGVARCGCWR